MSVLQVWLVAGIPGLILAFALFYGRSPLRSALGYLALAVTFGVVVAVDRGSGAVIGGIAALLIGAGRGGQTDAQPADTSTIAVPESVRRPARRGHR